MEHSGMRIMREKAICTSWSRRAAHTAASMRWNIFITGCGGSGNRRRLRIRTLAETAAGSQLLKLPYFVRDTAGKRSHGFYAFLHARVNPFPCELLEASGKEADAVVEHPAVSFRLKIGMKELISLVLNLS